MRILAFSDLHGRHYREANKLINSLAPDWIVLLGDILPDFSRVAGAGNRLSCQREYWQTYSGMFEAREITTTFVRGNHEIEGFLIPIQQRRVHPAFENGVIRLEGIPAEFGAWGWSREWEESELERELAEQRSQAPAPSVILSHVPPFGCLDEFCAGKHIGHRPLAEWLKAVDAGPELVLCGHVHEGRGFERLGNSLVVNMAEGYALLEREIESALWTPWRVRRLMSMEELRTRLEDEEETWCER